MDHEEVFRKQILPIVRQRPDLWPGEWGDLERFIWAAGNVQTRAFHLQKENFVTGESTSGCFLLHICPDKHQAEKIA